MARFVDGPASALFEPLPIEGTTPPTEVSFEGMSEEWRSVRDDALTGECVCRGVPFSIDRVQVVQNGPITISLEPVRATCLAFMHTADLAPQQGGWGVSGLPRQAYALGEPAADYVILYEGGAEERVAIKRRYQVGSFRNDLCLQAVPQRRSIPVPASYEQATNQYGWREMRAPKYVVDPWMNWLWAWENPHPERAVCGIRLEPGNSVLVISAITAGQSSWNPFRWRPRRKALLSLPDGVAFDSKLDELGLLKQIRLDLGHVISARPRTIYPNTEWEGRSPFEIPKVSETELIVEYTSHPDASFHFDTATVVPVSDVEKKGEAGRLKVVAPADRKVRLRVVEAGSGKPLAVKLHVHGEAGEYLPPVDHHRIPNPNFFEDYGTDHCHQGIHLATYIPGEVDLRLPIGEVYLEISKGFEIRPVRKRIVIAPGTEEIEVPVSKALDWRERGWVTADTHVHFLSPSTALLEGEAEGVNVVNLLASQWGEMMTNVGDFDGRTTHGSKEAGGTGEYLVRVGTENRQHVLGHISLLGYRGGMISPLCSGGPDESALGDAVEILLTEWARRCKDQKGLVVMSHVPIFSMESAASLVEGVIDAVEMVSWGNMYGGLNPYSLAHWYRYLNCGYLVPAVGGTDKMGQSTAVGTVRTYAHVAGEAEFTYESWMQAIYGKQTFVTYGPLAEFRVEGSPMGSTIDVSSTGASVDVTWKVASVTVPMSRVELIVNGETVRESRVDAWAGEGSWRLKIEGSSWAALLVRGHYPGKPEIIAAHTTPVILKAGDSPLYVESDALAILEQIEGSLAYIDSVGTRADDRTYKRMRMVLEEAHRKMHNRMHSMGYYHKHEPQAESSKD
jgi:hypothetical protein